MAHGSGAARRGRDDPLGHGLRQRGGDRREERRLLYVALTRAREQLTVYAPLRYYHQRYRPRDTHGYSQVSRFLTGPARTAFDLTGPTAPDPEPPRLTHTPTAVGDVLAALWH